MGCICCILKINHNSYWVSLQTVVLVELGYEKNHFYTFRF